MTLLHPWAIWFGAAGVALPAVVHLLTRPRPRPYPLSTIRFVRAALRDRRSRHRLRNFVVLGLRALAVLLLAAAVARPLGATRPLVVPDGPGATTRVVVLDVSQSMAAESRGVQLFERARPAAAAYLGDRPDLHAGLILAGASARPTFDRLSANTGALREDLGRASVRPERLSAQVAVNRAGELLSSAAAGSGRRELVIVSDFQRSNWASVDFGVLPAETLIQFESVAPAEALANLAVLRVATPGRVEQGRDVRIEVEVGNFSPAARQVQIEVAAGESVSRAEGLCAAGVRTTLAVEVPPRGTGWQTGLARIVGGRDALPADDSRPFVLDIRPLPSYALVTRQRPEERPSSSYYLERALSPLSPRPGRPEPRVTRLDPAQPDDGGLATADVIVIDHPGRFGADAARRVASLLKRGRGVLYAAAEPQDATNLKLITEAAGADLRMPVEFVPPAAGQRRRDLFLTSVRHDQPPFAAFGESPAWADGLRFAGGLSSRRLDQGLADDVLAGYSDRSACLVVTTCGDGVLAVLNADLGASNLPASPVFVPLMGELIGRLLGQKGGADALPCGEPAAVYLPGAAGTAAGLNASGPDTSGGQLREESGGILWSHTGAEAPGVYRVTRQGEVVFAVASALAAEESDLRPLDASVLPERLGTGRAVSFHSVSGGDDDRDTPWSALAVACVLCLFGELLALKAYRT
ncbi:BatA domain-containing protein [Gemmata sp.]|uniref:BatA domain-containing protein n=1 Tax=Gemmata sp. TaxID=1914242 RepID=UPI003F6EBF62